MRLDRFIHPRVESEIAFLLARDIEGPATIASVLAATEVVFGAVDVLDSRYESFKFTLSDVVADNASAGAFYLGPIARRPEELVDLGLLGCVVRVDGEVGMTAAGAAVMGHPAASVAWLVNQLAAGGEGLKAGSARVLRRGDRAGAGGRRRQRHLRVRRARRHRGVRRLTERRAGRSMPDIVRPRSCPPMRPPATPSSCSSHLGRKARWRRSTASRTAGGWCSARHRHGPARGRPLVMEAERGRRGGARAASRTCCGGTSNVRRPARADGQLAASAATTED